MPPTRIQRLPIILTAAWVMALAWIRLPVAGATETASPPNPSAPFDGVISKNMHTAAEMGIDDFQANRAPDKRYRAAPLKGLFAHAKGGFSMTEASRRCGMLWITTTASSSSA